LEDKLRITQKLDEFGIDYIEGGWPGANPKDTLYFKEVRKLPIKHTKIVAFGSTRRPNRKVEDDELVINLVKASPDAVTIFGKSWDLHVTEALKTTLEENLKMVKETCEFLKREIGEVIFDAEHFFDGFKRNREYALKVLEAAVEGGADWLVLCDTNGGSLPHEVYEITKQVAELFPEVKIGIHAHNDSDCAVANSLMAVLGGAQQVHGTINGLGERTGNANLCSVIPNLQLKMGYEVVPPEKLKQLKALAQFVAELANIPLPKNMPYVGDNAFAHKAGVHASAVLKNPETYEHINPELVGNRRIITVSDMAGKSNIVAKLKEYGITNVEPNSVEVRKLVEKIKELEKEGYHFEAAEASLELFIKRHFGLVKEYFNFDAYRILIAKRKTDISPVSEATVRVSLEEFEEHTAALGNGPVNALDRALRKALREFYPSIGDIQLIDYKVRIVNETAGTAAKVRVLIEFTDGRRKWSTVGVHENIIEASWIALVDGIIYKLMKDEEENLI